MFPDGNLPPPPWTQSVEEMRRGLAVNAPAWQAQTNYEVSQPPLYYALAGLWWRGGQWFGFHSGFLLYWLRFLNIVLVVALVWLGYLTARLVFPENLFLRLGVSAMIAFFPQTAFYSIQNDVLSPLCFGAVFICLLRFSNAEVPGVWLGTATGLALAATFLTKMTNVPLLAVSGIFIAWKIFTMAREKKLRAALPALAALFSFAASPAVGWTAWCRYNFGDFTGSKLKMDHFGWTYKPLGEWEHHPIFSPGGAWTYLRGELVTFWQTEFTWHDEPIASYALNNIYVAMTLFLLSLAVIFLFQRSTAPSQRKALWLAFASFMASLVFFALASIIYDFHDCPNPSREHPYFRAGRMLLGALIPFLLLFVYGLDRALSFTKRRWPRWLALAGIVLFMLISEIVTDRPAFSNEYNWFHL